MAPFVGVLFVLKKEVKSMAMIYDLSNEYGGLILSDLGTGNPAFQVNSNDPGQPALAILSTVSASPMVVRAPQAGNASVVPLGSLFQSTATNANALTIGRTVIGSPTIPALNLAHLSVASGAVINFGGGFISCTSVLGTAATGAAIGFDYVIPVSLNGVIRGIPVTSLASIPGAAAF